MNAGGKDETRMAGVLARQDIADLLSHVAAWRAAPIAPAANSASQSEWRAASTTSPTSCVSLGAIGGEGVLTASWVQR